MLYPDRLRLGLFTPSGEPPRRTGGTPWTICTDITTGSQFLSATGRLWTVRSITPTGTRVMLISDESDGQHGAMVDIAAVRRMVRVERSLRPADSEADGRSERRRGDVADLIRT